MEAGGDALGCRWQGAPRRGAQRLVDQLRIDVAIVRSTRRVLGQSATNVVVQVHWPIRAGGLSERLQAGDSMQRREEGVPVASLGREDLPTVRC